MGPGQPGEPEQASVAAAPSYGLYYPYVHLKDERWLKLALLYWPKMARLVVPGYPVEDSELVKATTGELGWLVDVSPGEARERVSPTFEEFLNSRPYDRIWDEQLSYSTNDIQRFGAADLSVPPDLVIRGWRVEGVSYTGLMPAAEFAPGLLDRLIASGMVKFQASSPDLEGGWLVIQREFAWAYKCLLSEEVALHNRLILTTDQTEACAAASGTSAQEVLLGGIQHWHRDDSSHRDFWRERDLMAKAATFSLLCLRVVVPSNIERVPIKKIIKLRRKHGDEFDAWRADVDVLAANVARDVSMMASPEVIDAYLTDAVNRYTATSLQGMRRGLRDVGLDAAEGVMNLKVQAPSVVLAAAGIAEHSTIALASGAAIGLAQLYRTTRDKRRSQMRSPASYLWSVHHDLDLASNVRKLRNMMHVAVGS